MPVEARDWDAIPPLVADDFAYNDPRRVFGTGEQTRATVAPALRAQEGLGIQHFAITVVATRGDRLALLVVSAEEQGGDVFATTNHVLVETTAAGQLASIRVFERDDVDRALDDLDARYLAGQGAPYAEMIRAVVASNRAYNARDWDAFRACYAPGVVALDHRPAGWGALEGVDAQMATLQGLIAMVPDVHMTMNTIHDLSEQAILYSARVVGEEIGGGHIELAFHVLNRHDDTGITAMEIFPASALDDAIAAFRGDDAAAVLRNACTDAAHRLTELVEARDWTGLRALFAPDLHNEERRRSLSADGADPVENHRMAFDLGARTVNCTVIAIRGDRLALVRNAYRGNDRDREAFEVDVLALAQVDAKGRFVWLLTFDADDLDAAFAELEARYVASEAAAHADVYRTCFRFGDLYAARDWDGLRTLLSDDLTFVDHRPGSFAAVNNPDEYVRLVRMFVDFVPDVRGRSLVVHALDAHGCVSLVRNSGESTEGSPVEVLFLMMAIVQDDQIARIEIFPARALEEALEGFVALGPAPAPMIDNLCMRTMRRTNALWEREDWEELALSYAADVVFDDRRPGMSTLTIGRETMLANVRAVLDSGTFENVHTPIAVRGERCALFRYEFLSAAYEVDLLVLNEVDERGVVRATVIFDADDLDGAFAELEARYIAGEAAPHAGVYRACVRMADLTNARDWDGLLALWSDDLVIVDHRPGSFGHVEDRDEFLRFVRGLHDLVPDTIVRRLVIHRLDARGCVALARHGGTSAGGGAVEIVFLFILIVRDDHIARFEQFPAHALDEALQRFAELGPSTRATLDNLCLQVLRRNNELSASENWEDQFRHFADDAVLDDRRPGLRSVTTGRETMLANARTSRQAGPVEHVDTAIAIRGARYALFRRRFTTPFYEVDMSIVNEVDELGVVQAMVIFDADDLDGAFAELDARATSRAKVHRSPM